MVWPRGEPAAPPKTGVGDTTGIAEDLAALRPHLLDLHRRLLEAERVDLERYGGRLTGAEFLQIASQSFRLAWLRPLSELIAAIDEALDADGTEPAAETPEPEGEEAGAARTPENLGAECGVCAQERRSLAIIHAQAGKEATGRVRRACGFGAEQVEAVNVQRRQLLLHRERLHGFQNVSHGHGFRLGIERCDGERAAAAAEQQGCDQGGDVAGMMFESVSGSLEQTLAGGDQAMIQTRNP